MTSLSGHANFIQKAFPFGKRQVDNRTPVVVKKIKNHQPDRHIREKTRGWFLPPQAFLKHGERQNAVVRIGHHFAVCDEGVVRLASKFFAGLDDFGECIRNVIQCSGIDRRPWRFHVQLCANSVVLVFDVERPGEIRKDLIFGLSGRGEHEFHRAKKSGGGLSELAFPGDDCGFSNISQCHIGTPDCLHRTVKCLCNRFFDRVFLEADPHVAGNDLDHILRFSRGELAQQICNRGELRRIPGEHDNAFKDREDLLRRDIGTCWICQKLFGDISEIRNLHVGVFYC